MEEQLNKIEKQEHKFTDAFGNEIQVGDVIMFALSTGGSFKVGTITGLKTGWALGKCRDSVTVDGYRILYLRTYLVGGDVPLPEEWD